MSLGWELIQVCIARDQWTNADPGEDAEYVCTGGSCDCEMAGGTCSALGACLLRDQASACSCGGVLSRVDKDGGIPGWLFPVIAVLVLAMIALACKYWRSKKGKRRKENKISELERRMHDMQNVDSELDNVNKIIADAQKKAAELMARRAVMQEIPHTWDPRVPDDQNIIELQPNDEQYWVVSDRLRETMQDAWVSKVWRIQNNDLWNYYSFHKGRLANQGFDEERHVWHGTSGLDPSCIYNDQQDGFMMQFSAMGFWGRGIYFALKSAYSYHYSFKPATTPDDPERPGGAQDEREMFLAKLLVGDVVMMNRDESDAKAAECKKLIVPPPNPVTGKKYNTVTGNTGGSQVWIVYENGRAYPDYLVRYYKGSRDDARTPYGSLQEAQAKLGKRSTSAALAHATISGETWQDAPEDYVPAPEPQQPRRPVPQRLTPPRRRSPAPRLPTAVFEFESAPGVWQQYDPPAQAQLEQAFQTKTKVQMTFGQWKYEIDTQRMTQTNMGHPDNTQRPIRRTQARP